MLSKDPIKRDINGYPYCNNDPVNCVDPTGEIANVLIGGAIGGLVGGAFGFANSAVSQLMSGKGFDSGKAWGAAANGAIAGAVKGAVAGSGVGLPLAIAADFAAGTIGSAVEQGISEGVVDVGKSIAGGLTNAVNGLIYGNDTLKSLGEAAVKGAASGALTSGINYLADVTSPQPAARRSPGIQYQSGAAGMFRPRDPKRGCVPSDPSIGSLRYGRDYGYQYNVPVSGEESQNRRGFSLCDFMKEMLTGAVTGGMAGATFYGAGRAVSALKESIKRDRGATFEGTIYRSVNKDYNPLEMSEYTINSNHRYTEKGMPGLYFSSGEKIVKAELRNYDVYDFSNRTMYSYDVKLTNMLDVSNGTVRSELGVSLDSLIGDSYDVTHAIGRYAYTNGYNGIIAPSARADGGVNLILFSGKGVK
jgi:RES domain-containing protein